MNKTFLRVAFATVLAFIMPSTSNAQLGDLLNSAASKVANAGSNSSNSTVSTLTNVVTSLLGTSTVSESSILGTWTYQEPCIAAESSNVLTKATAAAAVSKAQKSLSSALSKAGIKAGTMTITFSEGGAAKVTVGKKTVAATYTLSGSDITITFTKVKKTVKMNCKLSSGRLQLAMKSDKLLTVINTISSAASSACSTLSTLNSILKNVDGLYVGLQFTK